MWLSADEQIILQYLKNVGEVGASGREICRKSSTKDRWKDDERWAFPFLSALKDKKLIESTPSGSYRLVPEKDEEEEQKKRQQGRA